MKTGSNIDDIHNERKSDRMAKFKWTDITYKDVIDAIELFETENPEYPEPRSTFLLYNDKKYPAKHIRGMAYKIHFGQEISKENYAGGQETVRFFERLGFKMHYTHKSIKNNSTAEMNKKQVGDKNTKDCPETVKLSEKSDDSERVPIKIGLYLQTDEFCTKNDFENAMEKVRLSDIDILVLPEFSYVPFEQDFNKCDITAEEDFHFILDKTFELSRNIGRAIVVCNKDGYGTIVSIYANAQAEKNETDCTYYIKHTMTDCSAFEFENYRDFSEELFKPVMYKGYRIGLTICYDCNHSVFSRKYGISGVDIILNSTGGGVVYDKWYKYNKVRAIENNCFTFVTMGGDGRGNNPHNYVYGFTPTGKEMHPVLLSGKNSDKRNCSGEIYIYSTAEYDGTSEPDPSAYQAESVNKKSDLSVPVNSAYEFFNKADIIDDKISVLHHNGMNVVICLVDGEDIFRPEKLLKQLYSEKLKGINNKRYIVLNHWKTVGMGLYNTKLSVVLKVRSMENYCAVILESDNLKKCYQCGQNRTAQVVMETNGYFGIDLNRTGGPETIWRNKNYTKACWRENLEWLISTF